MSAPLAVGFDGRYFDATFPGIGRYAFELLGALADTEFTIRVLVPAAPGSHRFDLSALAGKGVTLVPCDVPRRAWAEQTRLPAVIRQLDCDVWHAPYYWTAFRPLRPWVVSIHDAIGALDPAFLTPWPKRWANRCLNSLAARSADRVVTPTAAARADVVRCFGAAADRVAVVPMGVAGRFAPPTDEDVAAVRARLDLPARYALYVGTDKPHKNLVRLCRAWTRVAGGPGPSTTLVLAGFQPINGATRDAGDSCGTGDSSVRVLGPVDDTDLPALYGGATVFVLPSLAEGFGLPVLEAMACGVPVACARAGGLPEVAGDAAAYFDPRDQTSIATVVGDLLRDAGRRHALARAGLERARQWTWARTAARMAALYREVAEQTT